MTSIGVVGLGYVGIEVAKLGMDRGYDVHACDVDKSVLDSLERGDLIAGVDSEDISTTTDGAAVAAATDVIVMAVPTPLDSSYTVDLTALEAATETVADGLADNDGTPLVVVESTVPPQTTKSVVRPILEGDELIVGEDFYLAHAPERIDPGNEEWPLERLPRVVGAVTPEGRVVARDFYNEFLDAAVHGVDSTGIAEAAKIVENAYRDINIAFANEIALSLEGLDIDAMAALNAADTKPFGFTKFEPGAGVGGHCIPVDPHLLIDQATQSGFDHQMLKTARSINEQMPVHIAEKTIRALNNARVAPYDARVLLLGKTFKPGVDDVRNSPYFRIKSELAAYDCIIDTYDPQLPEQSTVDSPYVDVDAAVLVTAHEEFVDLNAERLEERGVSVVVDGRNVLDGSRFSAIGITYRGVGRECGQRRE